MERLVMGRQSAPSDIGVGSAIQVAGHAWAAHRLDFQSGIALTDGRQIHPGIPPDEARGRLDNTAVGDK